MDSTPPKPQKSNSRARSQCESQEPRESERHSFDVGREIKSASSDLLPLNMLPVWFFSMSSSCALRRPKLAATSELRVSPLMMNDGLPGSAFVGEVQVPVSMRVSVWVGTRFKVGFKVELGGPGQGHDSRGVLRFRGRVGVGVGCLTPILTRDTHTSHLSYYNQCYRLVH